MKLLLTIVSTFFLSFAVHTEPWIDTSNLFLRAKIQYLSDRGYIKTPTTTYPLMWVNIVKDLKNLPLSSLNQKEKTSHAYIMHQFKLAKRNQKTIELNAAIKNNRFASFGNNYRDKNNIAIRASSMSDSFALKLSTTYNNSSDDKIRYDGSYLAMFAGNWVASIGMQDRWWGNGWDSNLSLTNNARPIPALALTRKASDPFILPFTEYGIPWTVTTFMGIMDDNRIIKNTLLWGFRLNFKPTQNLEIGITRLAQWGGEGRPQNSTTFWNVLIGKDNCGAGGLDCSSDISQEPGNQQAGYDLRYTFNILDNPFSIYGQYYAEDGDNSSSFGFLTEPVTLIGFDTHIIPFNKPSTVYIEYSDTYADCSDSNGVDTGNCFNEHHTYSTGMRYEQRAIGNLYDNDAKAIVFGVISELATNTNLELKLQKLQLNYDNSDKAPSNPLIGNPVSSIAEDIIILSAKIQHSYRNWRFTIGSDYSHSTFENNLSDESNFNAFFNIEYNL